MSTTNQPEVMMTVTPVAGVEVKKFMSQEGVDPAVGGLRDARRQLGHRHAGDQPGGAGLHGACKQLASRQHAMRAGIEGISG